MSQEAIQQIIGRAVTDAAFRTQLFNNPAGALESYQLSDAERAMLQHLDEGTLSEFAGRLDERITKGKWLPGGS